MKIDRSYISSQNTYEENDPRCIVVHNTDNFRAGADARTHAEAQHNGELSNMSAHYYVDDGETAYQAAPHSRGCWHVGVNYGGANLLDAMAIGAASAWKCVCRADMTMRRLSVIPLRWSRRS